MEKLTILKPQFNNSCTYRIVGQIVEDKGIALFDITKATIYEGLSINER